MKSNWTQLHQIYGPNRIGYRPEIVGSTSNEIAYAEALEESRTINMLSRALNTGAVIGFVGSGVSKNYGYPLWQTMAKEIINEAICEWRNPLDKNLEEQREKETFIIKEALEKHLDKISNESLITWLGEACRLMNEMDSMDIAADNAFSKDDQTLRTTQFGPQPDERQIMQVGDRFLRAIERIFVKHIKNKKCTVDPLRQMIQDLGIRRFVTTNYDRSIIQSLTRYAPELNADAVAPSKEDIHKIIEFSTRVNVRDGGVLHLHGILPETVHDQPVVPLIISDRDYQQEYYTTEDDEPLRSYRSSIAHLFRSNAFLFVGTSLSENEVIRPLRMLAAERENHPTPREIFAILQSSPSEAVIRADLRNFLYNTYGIRSIFFNVEEDGQIGPTFSSKLEDIARARARWWKEWRETPLIRFPVYGPKEGSDYQDCSKKKFMKKREDVKELTGVCTEIAERFNPEIAPYHNSVDLHRRRPNAAYRHPLVPSEEAWLAERKCVKDHPLAAYLKPLNFWPLSADCLNSPNDDNISTLLPNPEGPSLSRNAKKIRNALANQDSRVILALGSDGSGKRQVEQTVYKHHQELRDSAPSDQPKIIAGTVYFSFDFQSLLGYFYDQTIVREQHAGKKDQEDSIARFGLVLDNLKSNETLLIDGIDHLLTDLKEVEIPTDIANNPTQQAANLSALSSEDVIKAGIPTNDSLNRFFKLLKEFAAKNCPNAGRVILVGSALPRDYLDAALSGDNNKKLKGLHIVRVERPSPQQILALASFNRAIRHVLDGKSKFADEASATSWLQGIEKHFSGIAWSIGAAVYPMTVLDRYLASIIEGSFPNDDYTKDHERFREVIDTQVTKRLQKLEDYISSRGGAGQKGRLIEQIIDDLDEALRLNIEIINTPNSEILQNEFDENYKFCAKLIGILSDISHCLATPKNEIIHVRDILLRLALFWQPTSAQTLAASFAGSKLNQLDTTKKKDCIKEYNKTGSCKEGCHIEYCNCIFSVTIEFDKVLQELARLNLVFPVRRAPRRSWENSAQRRPYGRRYVVHRLVRQQMLRLLGAAPRVDGTVRRFVAGTFAAESEPRPTHSERGYFVAAGALNKLLEHLEDRENWEEPKRVQLEDKCKPLETYKNGERYRAPSRNMLRAAIGLMRSSWDAVALANIHRDTNVRSNSGTSYPHLLDEYLAWMSRIANLLNVCRTAATNWGEDFKELRSPLWRDGEAPDLQWSVDGILYGHELTWFYNELGLASFVHGALHDAYPYFETALNLTNIMNRADKDAPIEKAMKGAFGTRWAAVHANLAMVRLERGNLLEAEHDFRQVDRVLKEIGPSTSYVRNQGWIARVQYFVGQKDKALESYVRILAPENQDLNARARSMFFRHRAELHRSQGRFESALEDLDTSYSIAASGDHLDQMSATHVSRIYTKFMQEQGKGSFKQIDPEIAFARRTGLLKLEANFCRVQARIALAQGYPEVAFRLALRSTEIVNYNGVLLDLTASLAVLGQSAASLLNVEIAQDILKQALRLADRQHYIQQRSIVERSLSELSSGNRQPITIFADAAPNVTVS